MNRKYLIQVKHDRFEGIYLTDIFYIQFEGRYAKFVTSKFTYLLPTTLKALEASLPQDLFCRVHRAYIVQMPSIISVSEDLIHLENRDIPLGKLYRKELFARMDLFKG